MSDTTLAITLVPVAPTGERTDPCFLDGPDAHEFRMMTFPTYPPSPRGKALRDLRTHADLTMGDLARALDLRVEDVSSLEWGRLTLSDADWCAVFVAVAEASRREHPPQVLDVDAMLAGDGGVAAPDEDDTVEYERSGEGWSARITCEACPLQIEGTVDGAHLYLRDRHGNYGVGIGPTEKDALRCAMGFVGCTGWAMWGDGDLTPAEAWCEVEAAIAAWRAEGRPMTTVSDPAETTDG